MNFVNFWKQSVLFYLGGTAYMGLEVAFRGWSHGSMFLAGGTCFLLLGKLQRAEPRLPLAVRMVLGTVTITAVELAAGLLFNRRYQVWDYRGQPLNFHGQICLPFSLLWMPVSLAAMLLYDRVERIVKMGEKTGK